MRAALLNRGLQAQWHVIYARMAPYIERCMIDHTYLWTPGLLRVVRELLCGLDEYGKLDYRPYQLGPAGRRLLDRASSHGWQTGLG